MSTPEKTWMSRGASALKRGKTSMASGFLRLLVLPLRKMRRVKAAGLYGKIGGEPAIEKVVELLYIKVLGDEHIRGFFDDMCMHYQRYKLRVFLTMALGGPVRYTGKDLRSAHARLVEKGMTDSHFDQLLVHLRSVLEALNLQTAEIDQVIAIAESQRSNVLNR